MDDFKKLVSDLVGRPTEEEWFEFKENWYEAHALGEYISSLSNAAAFHGRSEGYLVWGVENGTHSIVGTEFVWRRDVKGEPLEHYLARQLNPDLAFRFDEGNLNGKRIVALIVPAASKVPTSFDGVRYSRIGSSKVNLAKHPDWESALFDVLRNGPATMANTEASNQDLSFVRLFTYYAGRGIELRTRTFAKTLGLLTRTGAYNLLAQLLSDDSGTPIRVSIFQGATKATPLYSVREFGNTCLLISLEQVLDYIDVLNVVQADERNRIVERKDVPLMNSRAVREAVINAFVHNRWVGGNAPMFTVYSDRLEIVSHGALPPDQTMEGFYAGVSVPVNKELSDIFLQLHISERSGRGVPKIVEEYGRGSYAFESGFITLTIPFHRIGAERSSGSSSPLAPPVGLNATQQKVLDLIRDDPNITHNGLATALGKSTVTAQKAVRFLREHGFIERVGSDRSGWWRVL